MTKMTGEEKIIDLLSQILQELKKNNLEIEDLKNLFMKYDQDLLLEDENLREG